MSLIFNKHAIPDAQLQSNRRAWQIASQSYFSLADLNIARLPSAYNNTSFTYIMLFSRSVSEHEWWICDRLGWNAWSGGKAISPKYFSIAEAITGFLTDHPNVILEGESLGLSAVHSIRLC